MTMNVHTQPETAEDLEQLSRHFCDANEACRHGLLDFAPLPCPAPTGAAPGSAKKKRILAQRFAAGVELWHPKDQKINLT